MDAPSVWIVQHAPVWLIMKPKGASIPSEYPDILHALLFQLSAELRGRCCQFNAIRSQKYRIPVLSGCQLTPLSQGYRAILLKNFAAIEVAVLVEMIVDRGVNGSKLLQGLDVSETGHRAL